MNTRNKAIVGVVVIIIIIVLAIAGWYLFMGKGAGSNEAVAIVNGQNITRAQLNSVEQQIESQQGIQATTTDEESQLQTAALNSLIAQDLLFQAATKAGITASSTEVDAQLQATKDQLGSADAYQKALASQGMTESDLKTEIATDLTIQAYLDQTLDLSSATATDAEIQSTYDQAIVGQSNVPPLDQVRDQVAAQVVQQKQQQMISDQVDKLRAAGNVQVLI